MFTGTQTKKNSKPGNRKVISFVHGAPFSFCVTATSTSLRATACHNSLFLFERTFARAATQFPRADRLRLMDLHSSRRWYRAFDRFELSLPAKSASIKVCFRKQNVVYVSQSNRVPNIIPWYPVVSRQGCQAADTQK